MKPSLKLFLEAVAAHDRGEACVVRVAEQGRLAIIDLLPPAFQAWLQASPYDEARFGDTSIAGSPNALQRNIERRRDSLPTGMVPFGWSEDMGADLCFLLSSDPLADDAEVVAVDHETGRPRTIGPFGELMEGWTKYIGDLEHWSKRFEGPA